MNEEQIEKLAREAADECAIGVSPEEATDIIYDALRKAVAEVQPPREKLAEGRDHLTASGTFRSDKYKWCPDGFVPLKLTDPAARDLLAEYARRRGAIDIDFALDLHGALGRTPEKPNDQYKPFETVKQLKDQLDVACEALDAIANDKTWNSYGVVAHHALAEIDKLGEKA